MTKDFQGDGYLDKLSIGIWGYTLYNVQALCGLDTGQWTTMQKKTNLII